MSSIHHKYADFSGFGTKAATENADDEKLEDLKLQSFEEGYQAGWADAIKACEAEEKSVAAELQQSLQDMSFTYVEALTKLTNALRPLLQTMVAKVLPKAVECTLASHLAEQLETLMKGQIAQEASVRLGPKSKELIEQSLSQAQHKMALSLVVDPQMPEGQMHFKIGTAEAKLEFDTLLTDMSAAIDAHYSN